MKRMFAIALSCILIACTSVGLQTTEQQLAAGCAASSAALKALTLANDAGKLTTEQQTGVLHAIGYVEPVCTAPTPPTMDSIKLEAFTRAIAYLQAQAATLGATP